MRSFWEGPSGSSEEDITGDNWEHSLHRQKPPPVKFYCEIHKDNPDLQQSHQLLEKSTESLFQWLRAQNGMSIIKQFRSYSEETAYTTVSVTYNWFHRPTASCFVHAQLRNELAQLSEKSNRK